MPELEEQTDPAVEIEPPKPRNKGGRPRKDTNQGKVLDAPNPPFTKFDSNHRNPAQRTPAAWTWWNKLTDPVKGIIEAHVYRDWPVLLDPPEGEYKYIDVIIGTDPIQTDQDFIDKYGAGKYHIYLNANPAASEARRTLLTAFIDGSHDATKYPPCDRRIQNVENVSLTDPANAAYVALLKSQGKIPDEAKLTKEAEEMAATSGVMAELVKDMAQDRRELTQRLLEKTEQEKEIPADPPPSAEEKLNESLTLLEKLQNFTKGSPTADPLAMMTAVIEAAKVMSQSNSPQALAPFVDRIAALESQLRTQESEMLRGQLTEIKEQLRTLKEAPQSNITLADGTSVESIINKVVDRLADKPEVSPWLDIAKSAMPVLLPLFGGIAQRMMTPPAPAPAFPMPPATVGAPPPTQPAQLPAPAQPQPVAQAPQGGAYTTGNPQLDALLMAVVIPLADCLRDGETGAVFAEEFIELQGVEVHAMLAQVGVEPIANIIAAYPPLAGVMKKITREKLLRFVSEFCEYKPSPEPQPA